MVAEELPARGPWGLAWRRLKRNRAALAAGIVFLVIVLMCFVGAPVAAHLLGHGPDDPFPYAVSDELKPVGPWTRVPDTNEFVDVTADTPRTLLILGADGTLGRDQFLRLLYGGQVSLQIGLGAMLIALMIGVPFGIVAGYLGGWVDWTISRWTELFIGFPLPLFLVAISFRTARASATSRSRSFPTWRTGADPPDRGVLLVPAGADHPGSGARPGPPGIGRLVAWNLSGSSGYALHVLVGVVVLVTIAITFANLLSDLVVRALDPQIRVGS